MSVLARLRLPSAAPALPEEGKRAAVAAIFGPEDELLFIHRAERAGDLWSGHMAFPGGREDPGDASLLHTAVRETWEEIGLDLSGATCLGALEPVSSPRDSGLRQLTVVPWVFRVGAWGELRPNEEVAGVVRFGFSRLLAREARDTFPYAWQGRSWELPCVRLDGTLLWGMTLRMVDDLIARVEAG